MGDRHSFDPVDRCDILPLSNFGKLTLVFELILQCSSTAPKFVTHLGTLHSALVKCPLTNRGCGWRQVESCSPLSLDARRMSSYTEKFRKVMFCRSLFLVVVRLEIDGRSLARIEETAKARSKPRREEKGWVPVFSGRLACITGF